MVYAKKKLNEAYSKWRDTVSSYAGVKPKINKMSSSVSSKISSLDWQGEGKESVVGIIGDIDNSCQKIYTEISKNIQTINKCINISNDIEKLENKYKEYNKLVDDYYRALAELEKEKEKNKGAS